MSQNFITLLISFMNVTEFYNSINFFFENVNSQLIVIIKALVYSCPKLINLTSICTEMLAKFKIPNIYYTRYSSQITHLSTSFSYQCWWSFSFQIGLKKYLADVTAMSANGMCFGPYED